MISRCFLSDFELGEIFLLGWLPSKARDPILLYYLINRCEERFEMMDESVKRSKTTRVVKKVQSQLLTSSKGKIKQGQKI